MNSPEVLDGLEIMRRRELRDMRRERAKYFRKIKTFESEHDGLCATIARQAVKAIDEMIEHLKKE